jgi:hypothetical protein
MRRAYETHASRNALRLRCRCNVNDNDKSLMPLDPNVVVGPSAWAELCATSACGRAQPVRQRSLTASGAVS